VTAAEKAALRMKLGLPAGRPIFIYTGRICRAKGLLELLQIWERLIAPDGPYLLLIGSGAGLHESCEDEVRAMTARHPQSVAWRGGVQNVAQFLQASDVFVFLSYFEAFSLSMLEAVSVGLPCIVSDVGCARQIVQHRESGAILPARAGIETVLQEIAWMQAHRDEWPAMGGRGRARVMSGYGLETVAARYVGLCNSRLRRPDSA
ncbi:MAG: glycosyltransferase family 4 protein, partial [Steroidobacteraceae bacterium]